MIDLASDLAMAIDPALIMTRAGMEPDPWQRDVLAASGNVLINASRQSGKSASVAAKAVHRAVYSPGSLVLCISPSQRQSTELFDRIGETYRAIGGPVPIKSESAVRVKLANGSKVLSLPGSEATIRGFTPDLVLIDEAARVEDAILPAVRPMLGVSRGQLILLSTPFGCRGFFFEAWKKGGDAWTRFEIPATECPRISVEFLERERAAMTEFEFRSEYMCSFESNISSVFDHALIEAAVSVDVSRLFGMTS